MCLPQNSHSSKLCVVLINFDWLAQRLAEMTNALLKIAPYDKDTMSCKGLRRYVLDILPIIDWTQEAVRPALNLLLKRMEKVFTKLYKKPSLRVPR